MHSIAHAGMLEQLQPDDADVLADQLDWHLECEPECAPPTVQEAAAKADSTRFPLLLRLTGVLSYLVAMTDTQVQHVVQHGEGAMPHGNNEQMQKGTKLAVKRVAQAAARLGCTKLLTHESIQDMSKRWTARFIVSGSLADAPLPSGLKFAQRSVSYPAMVALLDKGKPATGKPFKSIVQARNLSVEFDRMCKDLQPQLYTNLSIWRDLLRFDPTLFVGDTTPKKMRNEPQSQRTGKEVLTQLPVTIPPMYKDCTDQLRWVPRTQQDAILLRNELRRDGMLPAHDAADSAHARAVDYEQARADAAAAATAAAAAAAAAEAAEAMLALANSTDSSALAVATDPAAAPAAAPARPRKAARTSAPQQASRRSARLDTQFLDRAVEQNRQRAEALRAAAAAEPHAVASSSAAACNGAVPASPQLHGDDAQNGAAEPAAPLLQADMLHDAACDLLPATYTFTAAQLAGLPGGAPWESARRVAVHADDSEAAEGAPPTMTSQGQWVHVTHDSYRYFWRPEHNQNQWHIDAFTCDPHDFVSSARGIKRRGAPQPPSSDPIMNFSVGQLPRMMVYIAVHAQHGTRVFYPYHGAKGGNRKEGSEGTWDGYKYWTGTLEDEDAEQLMSFHYYNQEPAMNNVAAVQKLLDASEDPKRVQPHLFLVCLHTFPSLTIESMLASQQSAHTTASPQVSCL